VRSGDTVGRFGGDEFGAIVSDLAKPGDAGVVAQKILDASPAFQARFARHLCQREHRHHPVPADGETPKPCHERRHRMYRAKEQAATPTSTSPAR